MIEIFSRSFFTCASVMVKNRLKQNSLISSVESQGMFDNGDYIEVVITHNETLAIPTLVRQSYH